MCDWETFTRVVPPLGDGTHSSLVSFLLEFGKKHGESMLIVYSRNMKQLVKCRFHGGLYERLEKIQECDHDIIIIDRHRGFFFLKVNYLDEKQQEQTGDPRFLLIQEKCDIAKRDFDHLKALMMEAGMKKRKQVNECFSLHFPIIAFPRVRKEEKQSQNALVLYEEQCQSQEHFETWWNKHINQKPKKFKLKPEAHLTLLAIFGAPVYVTAVLDNEEAGFQFLTERELEFLVLEPTKCIINEASETRTMKLMKEKARNIITKWFSQRQITEAEHILVLGSTENAMEELSETMPEWIGRSAMATYSTWTSKSLEEKGNMVSTVIQRCLTFCALPSIDIINEETRRDDEISKEEPAASNLRHLYLDHAEGYFWLFSPQDELPGKVYAELNCSYGSEVVARIDRSKPAKETTWLYQAEQFIKKTYREWETEKTTHLVPYVEDRDEWIKKAEHDSGIKAERSLILSLYELGKRKQLPMFITYNRNFAHLIKRKDVGGASEGILTGEHDIVLIHRELGAVFMQVKNLDTKPSEEKPSNAEKNSDSKLTQVEHCNTAGNRESMKTDMKRKNAIKRSIKAAEGQLEKDVNSLKAAIQESGVDDINVSLCVIALVNVRRDEVKEKPLCDSSPPTAFLCEEDLKSEEAIEHWWDEHIIPKLQNSIDSRTFLKLLAIYIAPVYVTPAHTARMNTQKLNFLTADKLDILVNGPKDFVVKGAAGTGKTWLLQEKIRNIVMSWFRHESVQDEDEKIILICCNGILYSHLLDTLPDLLVTSAMAMRRRWIQKTQDENEKRRVKDIILKNLIVCCKKHEIDLLYGDGSWMESYDKARSPSEKEEENEEFQTANLVWRIRNVTWEIFLFYRILLDSVVSLPPKKKERWTRKADIIQSLFRSFIPEMKDLRFLNEKIWAIALEGLENLDQLMNEGSVDQSMLEMSLRLSSCRARVTKLPEIQSPVLLDLEKIFKTIESPFHHVFVDEAEELCCSLSDHWLDSLRSLQKQGGGYFWRTYDPLSPFSMTEMPDSLKKELEDAHSLLTVLRNPVSVFHTWTTHLDRERDVQLSFPGTHDAAYKREEILSGHDLQGPNVERFPVHSSNLPEKILEILREKFGSGRHPGDIAVLFADHGDFLVHGERLRKEMEEKLRVYSTTRRLLVHHAQSFKGMEAPIVFLITNQRSNRKGNIYLGASRSTSHLFLIDMEATEQEDEQVNREQRKIRLATLSPDILKKLLSKVNLR
ncbi:unnamed protein product [Darwinula stevensoni]|uniref:Uncharacterized protein n=1 Tax=Darwinula stevensoni TaxID=69355 RepID=A0A7R8XBG8_9CRUS|nr:unnamed protein product [Darwinula stevensoni]CAG0891530.1 unnamed protein product [Darwinula stevensoni]